MSTTNPTESFIQEQKEHERPNQTFVQRYFGGLRRTLRFFLIVAIAILIVNISWLGFARSHYSGIAGGYGVIQQGNCNAAMETNKWLHLLINVLSTLLLTGSNAFMTTYCCPSRQEVDAAHAEKKWLHVGMLSLRNFRWIAKRKSVLVGLLCLSSLPFHLLYGSAVAPLLVGL
jgi:hypothetical protein